MPSVLSGKTLRSISSICSLITGTGALLLLAPLAHAADGKTPGQPVPPQAGDFTLKLELKEKLYFAWNQGTLKESSFPVLDEVVKALNDNKGFRVQVEGHTSSEGADERNQTLSELRANAVLACLVAHGIGKERLVSKGFGGSVPIETNATAAGRENNRRVEFVVNFIIVNDGSKQ